MSPADPGDFGALMDVALSEARATLDHDDVPIGAVVARAADEPRSSSDATTNASACTIRPHTPSCSRSATHRRYWARRTSTVTSS